MDSFIMFRSFFKGMKNLDDHSWRQMVEAIAAYSMDGVEPELPDHLVMAFEFARPNIDKAKSVRERGSKGGSSSKSQANEICLQANSNSLQANEISLQAKSNSLQATYLEDKDKDKDKDIDKDRDKEMEEEPEEEPTSAPAPVPLTHRRHRYGTYGNVLLSDQEMEKLRSEFPDWEEWIRKVDNYTQSSGKRYKDYLAVIRNWARRDSEQRTRSGPLNNFTDTGSTDLDRVLEEHRQRMIDRVASITGGAT